MNVCCSSESPGLSLGLQQSQDVALSDGSLHVADDGAVLLTQELHLDLCTLTLRSGAAQHLGHASQSHLFVHSLI